MSSLTSEPAHNHNTSQYVYLDVYLVPAHMHGAEFAGVVPVVAVVQHAVLDRQLVRDVGAGVGVGQLRADL